MVSSVSVHADSGTDWTLTEVLESSSHKAVGSMDREAGSMDEGGSCETQALRCTGNPEEE